MKNKKKMKYLKHMVKAYRHFMAPVIVIKVNKKSKVEKNDVDG